MARGSIRKLDGAWGFRIDLGPDPATGKRRQVSKQGFTTKRDAESALRELSQSVDKGTLAKRSMRTLGDYLDEWHVAGNARGVPQTRPRTRPKSPLDTKRLRSRAASWSPPAGLPGGVIGGPQRSSDDTPGVCSRTSSH